ncbi:hypothetical protein OPQ81_005065 [Rhizoctonia solani]|nr:hypothetical protein OPQ81_005065 [Rhizoctonia solani]
MSFSAPLSPPTNLSPMDITPGGCGDNDTSVNTSTDPSPDSTLSNAPNASSSTSLSSQQATNTPSDSVTFPKTLQFTSQVVPPTPPSVPGDRLSRPQLTSRLSSRSGGKRHASIGSAREVPFPLPQDHSSSSSTASQHNHTSSTDAATPGWNARLRDMGIFLPGMGPSTPNPRTPKSPRSGSMSSGGATPKSPDEQRAASYFSFRRRRSSGGTSPGKVRTPPVLAPPPPPAVEDNKRKEKEKDTMPSPIAEESSPSPVPNSKRTRANLSLDLSSNLTSRGSTASLPLIGHTPIEHLLQQDDAQKPRRASMVAPLVAPPHVHTPPVHPPAYEYPFLPHHAPRQPLEVRVEDNPPGPGMEAGSWLISVRLPGFTPDGITVGTRRGRVLMIVADNYNDDDGGHFERRISFGYDADMAAIRAEFNGDMLRVTVPRRWIFGTMGMMARSNTLGQGPGAKPTIEQPTSRSTAGNSAGRPMDSTKLSGMS